MRNFYEDIEIDHYVNLSTLQNFHFGEYSIFVYQICIVLQRYSVFVDSLYDCRYLPIAKIFLDNYL